MSDSGGPAHFPYDELETDVGGDPAALGELQALHAQIRHDTPDPERIRGHVDTLRGVRDAEARVANWWDNPETQRWIMAITNAGL